MNYVDPQAVGGDTATIAQLDDRRGPAPERAWVEVRGPYGELLRRADAAISGNWISVQVPAFMAGLRGSIELFIDDWATAHPIGRGVEELPTEPFLYERMI